MPHTRRPQKPAVNPRKKRLDVIKSRLVRFKAREVYDGETEAHRRLSHVLKELDDIGELLAIENNKNAPVEGK